MLLLLVEALLSHDAKAAGSVLDDLERSGIEPADLLERSIALISSYILAHVTAADPATRKFVRGWGGFQMAHWLTLPRAWRVCRSSRPIFRIRTPWFRRRCSPWPRFAASSTRMREERKVEPVQFVSRDVHKREPAGVDAESPAGPKAEPKPVAQAAGPASGEGCRHSTVGPLQGGRFRGKQADWRDAAGSELWHSCSCAPERSNWLQN